jgi:phosphatidylserine/phosphatidylglycerophosphate/cardiolipin synthase-like enzyme
VTTEPKNRYTLRRGIELRRAPLDDLTAAVTAARSRIWIASPFVGGAVAEQVAELITDRRASRRTLDLKGLTNLSRGALIGGFSSADGIRALLTAGIAFRAASNLHAKIVIVDSTFALVGSSNLTSPGTGASEQHNNAQLGVVFTSPAEVERVADVFEMSWNELGRTKDSMRSSSTASRPCGRPAAPSIRSSDVICPSRGSSRRNSDAERARSQLSSMDF